MKIAKLLTCFFFLPLLAQADLNNGLAAYYPLNGNANDVSGNGNDGVETGTTYVPGVDGLAASFNGTSDFIAMGETASILNSQQVSFSYWVKFTDLSVIALQGVMIVSYDGGFFEDGDILLRLNPLGFFNIQYGTGPNQGHHREFFTSFDENQWYHLALVLDSTKANPEDRSRFYVNGVEVTQSNFFQSNASQNANIGNTADPFRIAYWRDIFTTERYFPGEIDDLRIYNRILTSDEIANLYAPNDSDGDGVPDDVDDCSDSVLDNTVSIAGCDSGVDNPLGENGCTLADIINDLVALSADGANSHGQFVSRFTKALRELQRAGIITKAEKDALRSCAKQADIL